MIVARCRDCFHCDACVSIAILSHPTLTKVQVEAALSRSNSCKNFKATADVVEDKHGRWEIKTDDYDCEYMMCSCCKNEFYPFDADTVDTTPNYCPNCGAKMDGGDADGQTSENA